MKEFILAIVLVSFFQVCFAQHSEVRTVGSFRGVKTAEAVDVYLKKGDKESVRVETGSSNLSDVITEVSGTYLKIHMRSGSRGKEDVKVYVTYVQLDKISSSSASNIYGEESVKAESMQLEVSSAASIELTLDVENLVASASSAGDMELEGKSGSVSFSASSAGEIDAYGLKAGKVVAEASSAGSVKVSVSNELMANASSGGSIRYRGNPSKSITNSSSGGSVKKSSE